MKREPAKRAREIELDAINLCAASVEREGHALKAGRRKAELKVGPVLMENGAIEAHMVLGPLGLEAKLVVGDSV